MIILGCVALDPELLNKNLLRYVKNRLFHKVFFRSTLFLSIINIMRSARYLWNCLVNLLTPWVTLLEI